MEGVATSVERSGASPAGYLWAPALVAAATGVGLLAGARLDLPDVVMLFLLAIVIAAVRFGRGPALLAAGLSVAAFDFFFIPPFFSFAVSDFRHVFTFAMLFAVGLLISSLTQQLKEQERSARERENRTAVLYALSRDLAAAPDEEQAAQVLARHAVGLFGAGAGVVLSGPGGGALAARAGELVFEAAEQEESQRVLAPPAAAGVGTATFGTSRTTCLPLRSGEKTLGVLALSPRNPPADAETRELLETFVRQGALALERARLAEEAKAAALKARTEQMRGALLGAVSHDLRTPLAAITGAATTLRESGPKLEPAQRDDLVDAICEEAVRLERQVGNLLDMTRLQSGAVQPKREWVPLEDVVGSALNRLDERLGERVVKVEMPPQLVPVDPVLLEQLFVNLLDNALKYSPAGSPLELRAHLTRSAVEIELCDRGPGLSPEELDRAFDKFFRGQHPDVPGVGLGLAICKAIAEIHGGTLRARNREGGGACFVLTLPRLGEPPALAAGGEAR